jgi:hypothetical protein
MNYFRPIIAICLLAMVGLEAVPAQNVPSGMTYQGRLTDVSNVAVADGNGYEIEVRLWSASTGGTLLWGSRYTGVPLKSGAFNLILGSGGTPIAGATTTDLKAAFSTATVYLGLTATKSASGAAISFPTEILPRQQIFSNPYAFHADVAASVQADSVNSESIKNGQVTNDDLAPQSVATSQIVNGAVTNEKLSDRIVTPAKLVPDCAIIVDEKNQGILGGAAPQGQTWYQRTLNKVASIQGNSISLLPNNIINLAQGVYLIEGDAPAMGVSRTCAVLRKSGTQTIAIQGSSGLTQNAGNPICIRSIFRGIITVSAPSEQFEVWQYIQDSYGSNAFGEATNAPGAKEVYTSVKILRIQ